MTTHRDVAEGGSPTSRAAEEAEYPSEVRTGDLGLDPGAGLMPETTFLGGVARKRHGNKV